MAAMKPVTRCSSIRSRMRAALNRSSSTTCIAGHEAPDRGEAVGVVQRGRHQDALRRGNGAEGLHDASSPRPLEEQPLGC